MNTTAAGTNRGAGYRALELYRVDGGTQVRLASSRISNGVTPRLQATRVS